MKNKLAHSHLNKSNLLLKIHLGHKKYVFSKKICCEILRTGEKVYKAGKVCRFTLYSTLPGLFVF